MLFQRQIASEFLEFLQSWLFRDKVLLNLLHLLIFFPFSTFHFQEPTDFSRRKCFAHLGIRVTIRHVIQNFQFGNFLHPPHSGSSVPKNPNKTDLVVDCQEEDHDPHLHDRGGHHRHLHRPQLSRHSRLKNEDFQVFKKKILIFKFLKTKILIFKFSRIPRVSSDCKTKSDHIDPCTRVLSLFLLFSKLRRFTRHKFMRL